MRNKLVIGILGILLVFGAAAVAKNTSGEQSEDLKNLECTPEMMENMSENCPGEMMESGACENMMNNANACSRMMNNITESDEISDHCGYMYSDMGSIMGSGSAVKMTMMM